MNKTTSTLHSPAQLAVGGSSQEQWAEACSVFPIYLALAKLLNIETPFPSNKRELPQQADAELYKKMQTWLETMDQRVLVYQLRQLLQMTTLNANENSLRALIHRHLRKPAKTTADRDKVDFLLGQYFALCAPAKIYHKQIELADVAQVLKPIFGEVDPAPLAWCEPLEKMLATMRGFRGLREILKTNFIEQGRKVKESAGGMFYDPSALLAFTRFNFLLRRTIIELMHADLIAIRAGLAYLEANSVLVIDCHHFGLSAAEPLSKILEITNEWKQPFQKEYTEGSVTQAFEKLLGLREDMDKALQSLAARSGTTIPTSLRVASVQDVAENYPAQGMDHSISQHPPSKSPPDPGVSVALDYDSCLEKIWEQLIATPPTRGRSMTTVKMGTTRILLSSWEVVAFVSEDGPAAEDLRRAVVARAMLTTATEAAKSSGNASGLDKALSIARIEVARLQERVDIAKQAKDTEAAVNLGISTKRLLSALDEAEKL